jgi:hypothetical protein
VTTRPDHAAEAQKHIDAAHSQQSNDGEYEFSVRDNALIANAEATLALVEQQRIANIIAAYDKDALIYPAINATPYTERYALQRAERDRFEQRIATEVTAGVGIA